MKKVQFSRQRRLAEKALKNDKINHMVLLLLQKAENGRAAKSQISSGVSDVPPRKLAATLSRLDARWWRSNKAVWQLLSFFSSCLESTLRGTNEKLAGEQKRSRHTAAGAQRAGGGEPPSNASFDMLDRSAQAGPGKCHISTLRMHASPIGCHPTLGSCSGQIVLQNDVSSRSEDRNIYVMVNTDDHTYSPHPGRCAWWPWWAHTVYTCMLLSIIQGCNLLSLPFNCLFHSAMQCFCSVSKTE